MKYDYIRIIETNHYCIRSIYVELSTPTLF